MKTQGTGGAARALKRFAVAVLVAALCVPASSVAYAQPTGAVAGVVTANGTALSGARVVVFTWVDDDAGARWEQAGAAETASNGAYQVAGLAPGTYRVGFFDWALGLYVDQYWAGAAELRDSDDVVVVAESVTSGIDADLTGYGNIRGNVTAGGAAADGVSVVAFVRVQDGPEVRWDLVGWSTAGFDGNYDLAGLRAGTYRIGFFDWRGERKYLEQYWPGAAVLDGAREIAITTGEVVTGVDADMAPGGVISGTVVGDDGPLQNIFVDVYGTSSDGAGHQWLEARVLTGSDGAYRVGGLKPGKYRLGFADHAHNEHQTEYWSDAESLERASEIVVSAGVAVRGVDAQLPRARAGAAPAPAVLRTAGVSIRELAGKDRYGTAIAISKATFPEGGCDSVVVATGRTYPDALSASALAGAANAPILLVDGKASKLAANVEAEIKRVTSGSREFTVYLMGGTSAISAPLAAHLKARLSGEHVVRVAGRDRYGTAVQSAKITRDIAGAPLRDAFVVTGKDFPDGLLAGPVAAGSIRPILLTDNSRAVNERVLGALAYIEATDAQVIGTTVSVSDATLEALDTYVVGSAVRVAAGDAVASRSVEVAHWAVGEGLLTWSGMGLAAASQFPDGLTASVALGRAGSPLMLCSGSVTDGAKSECIAALKGTMLTVTCFGGPAAVPQVTRNHVLSLLQ